MIAYSPLRSEASVVSVHAMTANRLIVLTDDCHNIVDTIYCHDIVDSHHLVRVISAAGI